MKNTKWTIVFLFVLMTTGIVAYGQEVINSQKIWSEARHCAFTDLIYYKNTFYCCFRESNAHVPQRWADDGKIRVLKSKNGKDWQSFALLELPGVDLRDPKISVMPDGRLMLTMGGSLYFMGRFDGSCTHVAFYDKKQDVFSKPQPIVLSSDLYTGLDWLWKVTWHKGTAYGLVYQRTEGAAVSNNLVLVSSDDGLHYNLISRIPVSHLPNEAAVRFDKHGDMKIIVRCEDGVVGGYYGESSYPYTNWKVYDVGKQLGGPDMLFTPDGKTLVGTRAFGPKGPYMALMELDNNYKLQELCRFPSGGDCSYPGIVMKDGTLYISYYSSHDKNTAIYFSTIDYTKLSNK